MKNEVNMKKEKLKAKRAKVPEAKFSVITAHNECATFLCKDRK